MRVAEKWGLYKHIRFNTAVEEARWNGDTNKWETKTQVANGSKDAESGNAYTVTSDFLVSAVGQLNAPQYPDIPGFDDFQGKIIHSARWDWNYDIAGKRIAVIGNGATAAQIIPEVAKEAANVTVFQRTANWVIPREDAIIPKWERNMYRYIPGARRRHRSNLMDVRESLLYNLIVTNDAGGKDLLRQMSRDFMEKEIPNNAELISKLTPDYPPGCKRLIISDDFFEAMNKQHVTLETNKIQHFTTTGIVVDGKEYEVDMIVCATGFRTVEFMSPIKVFGLNGRNLADVWSDAPRAYLGMTVESLPNFAMLYGPNTNLGHNSIILMIEAQSRYITELASKVLQAKAAGGSLIIAPSPATVKHFNDQIQQDLSKSTYADSSCNSWYKLDNGLITNNWSTTVIDYQKQTSRINWKDFLISGSSSSQLLSHDSSYIGRVKEETTFGSLTLSAMVLGTASSLAFVAWKGLRVR